MDMIHVRAVCPPDLTEHTMALLSAEPCVLNLVLQTGGVRNPDGDAIECDVLTGAANEVLRGLRALGLEHDGSIVLDPVGLVFSERAARTGPSGSEPGCARRCGSRWRPGSGPRTSALLGVFISVTTIPAGAGIGVSCAFADWDEARGSLFQLLLNIVVLIVVGTGTLKCQRAIWRRVGERRHEDAVRRAA